MLMACYALIALGAACAALALAPRPPVALKAKVLAPVTGPLGSASRLVNARGRRDLSAFLSWFGRLIPRSGHPGGAPAERLVSTDVRLTREQWVGLKVLSALGGAFIYASVARELGGVQPILLGLAAAFGLILPNLWLAARVRRRQRAIVRLLPEVIDLLSLCIGAGIDFLAALNKVVLVKAFQREPLIDEFAIVLQEIKLGKRRVEALKAMMKRVNVSEVTSFVRTLVQADRMGTPIAEVLSVHSDDVRFQRFSRAERMALKAPIKILIPLIFCIMPCVGLVVGAPIFLQFLHQNPFGK